MVFGGVATEGVEAFLGLPGVIGVVCANILWLFLLGREISRLQLGILDRRWQQLAVGKDLTLSACKVSV